MPPGGPILHLMVSTVIVLQDNTVVTQLRTVQDKTFSTQMPPNGRFLHLMISTVIVLLDSTEVTPLHTV
jgi:hypothetical protein